MGDEMYHASRRRDDVRALPVEPAPCHARVNGRRVRPRVAWAGEAADHALPGTRRVDVNGYR
jgi:hypothetical protein